jgi:hypothetical protein
MLSNSLPDTLQAGCYSGHIVLQERAFVAIVGLNWFGREVVHLVDDNGGVWMILDPDIIKKVSAQLNAPLAH